MHSIKFIITLFFLLGFKSLLYASDTGCLLPDSRIYTSRVNPGLINSLLGGTPIYENNQSVELPPQCTSAIGSSCRVCFGAFSSFLGLITGCPSNFTFGSEVSYELNCSLDSNQLVLVFMSSGMALFFIYKKNIKHLFV